KLTGADLVVPQDRSAPFPRLAFGDRFLIAEEALLLIDARSSKVLWASSGAQRRPGSAYPATEAVALGDAPPLEARDQLVREALAREEQAGVAERIEARRVEVREELSRAESLLSRAGSAQDAGQLAAVEAEAPAPAPGRKARAAPRLPYRKFISRSGAPILVGRSARDNDALTLRVARGNDLW